MFQEIDTREIGENECFSQPSLRSVPAVDCSPNIDTLKARLLLSVRTCFDAAEVSEITLDKAKAFASQETDGIRNPVHLTSVKTTPPSLNITRSDHRVSHEMFTLKINSSKLRQPGTFVIEHQISKSAITRKKVVIQFPSVLGIQIQEKEITRDVNETPKSFLKRTDEANSQWAEEINILVKPTNTSRIQMQFEPNKNFDLLKRSLVSDKWLKEAIDGGISRQMHPEKSTSIGQPEALYPIAIDAAVVRAAQLAVLDLLDTCGNYVAHIIRMFVGVHQEFKCLLRQRMTGTAAAFEKEE